MFIVHTAGVFLEKLIIVFPGGTLQQMDGLRIIAMVLALAAQLVLSHRRKGQIHRQAQRVKGPRCV